MFYQTLNTNLRKEKRLNFDEPHLEFKTPYGSFVFVRPKKG